jgi:hypothetical protein
MMASQIDVRNRVNHRIGVETMVRNFGMTVSHARPSLRPPPRQFLNMRPRLTPGNASDSDLRHTGE